MNLLMPLFAVTLALMFNLNPAVKIALVALSVSPIPPVLPIKLMKAGGTKSHSIGLLVAMGLLAIIFVPVVMEILEQVFGIPLQMTMASIAVLILIMVLLPMILGVAVRSFVPGLAERQAKPISQVGSVGLLACAGLILFAAAPQVLTLLGTGTILALAAFVLVGLAVGHLLGGPEPEDRTALAFSTASRHPGVAIAIAHANFPQQKLALAAVLLYLLVSGIVSVPFSIWTKRRRPALANEAKA
jgi:BASS family bile acid:Na+ symporter